jgi:hypothetical protein
VGRPRIFTLQAFSRLFLAGQVTECHVSGAGAGIQARLHTWGRNHYDRPDIDIGGQISPVSKAGLRGSSYGLELNAKRAEEEARSGAAATKKKSWQSGSQSCIQGQEDRWSFRLACRKRFNRPAANLSNSRA